VSVKSSAKDSSTHFQSAIYEGWVRHRRSLPKKHEFQYRLFMMYLDLGELDEVFSLSPLWSTRGKALARFKRSDYLGDPTISLEKSVRDKIASEGFTVPDGPVRMLTHLRYYGRCFNPVTFYYCFDRNDPHRVHTIISEIENIPWGERHAYVLPRASSDTNGKSLRFGFEKVFHVSPFMQMKQDYRWVFSDPAKRLTVHMENFEDETKLFDATLSLGRREISRSSLHRLLLKYPWITATVVGGIYWNALRLWLKRVPYIPHPKNKATTR